MRASTATALFVLYSILNGATLSFVFLVYTASSITSTFFLFQAARVRVAAACQIEGCTVVYRGANDR